MADINVNVVLPEPISVDVVSPTQALNANVYIPGPQGPQGPIGPSGLSGVQGIQGPSGLQGVQGEQGPIGSSGLSGLQGIQGPSGLQGVQGPSGLQGIQGPSGVQGLKGDTGPQGPTGTVDTGAFDLRYYSINNPSGFITGVDLSSYLTSTNAAATYATIINLVLTGSNLQNQINNLDNIYATDTQLTSTGVSLGNRIDTLTTNLSTTGSTLNNRIDTLTTNLTSTGVSLGSRIDTLTTNLSTTGSTLNNRIDTLTTNLTSTGVSLGSRIDTLTTNLSTTGSTLNNRIDTLTTNLTSTGVSLGSRIDTLTTNLSTTGSTLNNRIDTLTTNLTSTGVSLGSRIDTLTTNLSTTGSTLNNRIDTLTTNLTSTGVSLGSRIDTLTTNLSTTGSTLNNRIDTLTTNLTSTGVSLGSRIDTLTTNLVSTGSALDNKIDLLSGVSVLTFGDQTITGLKNFITRPTVNTIPVSLSGENANGINVLVKNDDSVTLLKGQPVYIYGANGNNILVRLARNTGETTSSKTLGLLAQDLTSNAQGYAITEGALEGIDTNSANAGDPIWLGATGNLIFGLANKPYAPNHLVYLGVVERKQSNNGKIYVKIQNGFELQELHNVNLDHSYTLNNEDILRYNSASGLWFNQSLNTGIFQTQINSLSGDAVLKYGDQIIYGNKTFNNAVYIHDLYVTGDRFIVNTIDAFVESNYLLLNLTGGAFDGGIFFVTGTGFTGVNDYGPIIGFDHSNNFKFGIARRSDDLSSLPDIASVQELRLYSGVVNNVFATITNLSTTGSTLGNRIDTLTTNLSTTGSTLNNRIDTLTTNLTSTGVSLGNRIDTLTTNLSTTGSTLGNRIDTLTTNLTSTGVSLGNRIDTLTTNLSTTGSTLGNRIDTLTTNLTSTGVSLGNRIDTLTTNLSTTGSTLGNRIDTLTTNLTNTGVTLTNNINSLSGASVLTFGNQTISGIKTFINSGIFLDGIKIGTGSVYITENTIDTKNITFNTQIITGAEIEFTTTTGFAIDNIDTNLQLTRGNQGSIYNPLYGEAPINNNDKSNLQYYNPVNTMWNVDGWSDLTNLKNRVYKRFYYLWGGGNLGSFVTNAELIMHDTYNNKYYKVKFSYWQGGGGGQITYTRQLVTVNDTSINNSGVLNINYTATTGEAIFFTQPNNSVSDQDEGQYIDPIDVNLEITRGYGGLIYNIAYESTQQGLGGTSAPFGTEWNMDGWGNLHTLKNRTYKTFYNAATNNGDYGIGNSTLTGRNFVMHDNINDKYYLLKFTNWQGGGGGGFSYYRSLVTFNENQINFGSPINFINNVTFKSRPFVNGTGVLLSGEAAAGGGGVSGPVVMQTGDQTISGLKTFVDTTTFNSGAIFNNNISVFQTGIFGDMDISVDEMNISGLNLTITSGNLILARPTGIPATTGANGIKGSIVWDTGYLYVCTNTNSWRRAALNIW